MKILLLSDSHRCQKNMVFAMEQEQPDLVLHMGDHLDDARKLQQKFPQVPLYTVPGNCDLVGWETQLTTVHQLEGVSVLCTHGHEFGVKGGLAELEQAARRRQVQVALFGHTHRAVAVEKDGIWLINPGTCRGQIPWSYGVLYLEHGTINCEIREIEEEIL